MATQFLDLAGLSHYDSKIKAVSAGGISIAGKVVTLSAISGAVLGTFTVPDTVYSLATETADGLMSKADFAKLAGIAAGATKVEESTTNGNVKINGTEVVVYEPATYTAHEDAALYKITVTETGRFDRYGCHESRHYRSRHPGSGHDLRPCFCYC